MFVFCLFLFLRPTREFLTHFETAPLPVKAENCSPHNLDADKHGFLFKIKVVQRLLCAGIDISLWLKKDKILCWLHLNGWRKLGNSGHWYRMIKQCKHKTVWSPPIPIRDFWDPPEWPSPFNFYTLKSRDIKKL